MRTLAAGLAAVTLLGGCAQLREITESITREPARESARDPAPVESALSAGDRALAYYARLRRLPAAELTREREQARRALAANGSDENRMRYALALSDSIDSSAEAARVIELVDPIARRREAPLHGLAVTLRSLLVDLQVAHRERAELLRERGDWQRERTESQRERADLQRDRADLQRKLDSLKALEKSLSDRDGAQR